jgi:hypothetical protein
VRRGGQDRPTRPGCGKPIGAYEPIWRIAHKSAPNSRRGCNSTDDFAALLKAGVPRRSALTDCLTWSTIE